MSDSLRQGLVSGLRGEEVDDIAAMGDLGVHSDQRLCKARGIKKQNSESERLPANMQHT